MQNEIMLGIFSTYYFSYLEDKMGWERYPFEVTVPKDFWWNNPKGVLHVVGLGLSRAKHIHFLLDDLKLPLDKTVHTCMELKMLLDHPVHLDKTTFWLKGQKLQTEAVMDLLEHSNKKLNFNNLKVEDLI